MTFHPCACVCPECLRCHQSKRAKSTSVVATSVWNFLRRRPWRRWRRNSILWLESRAVVFVFVRACAHVFRECLFCNQFRTATSTSILTTSVWNFFLPPPSAALAQELRALAKKSCCGFCFWPPEPASWLPPFGFFFAAALGGAGAGIPHVG